MAVFSPGRLIRVLTTLVDRSLDEQEAVSGDGNRPGNGPGSKHSRPRLKLIGRDSNGTPRDDTQ